MVARRLRLGLVLALGVAVLAPIPCSAQDQRIFVLVDAIPGESQDPDHMGWIEATGLGQGVTVPVSDPAVGTRPEFQAIKILKHIDKASPKLFIAAAQGTIIQTVRIQLVRPIAGQPRVYFEIKLDNALISNISTTSDGTTPQELVGFNFKKITWTYSVYAADGTPQGQVTGSWDVTQNTQA